MKKKREREKIENIIVKRKERRKKLNKVQIEILKQNILK